MKYELTKLSSIVIFGLKPKKAENFKSLCNAASGIPSAKAQGKFHGNPRPNEMNSFIRAGFLSAGLRKGRLKRKAPPLSTSPPSPLQINGANLIFLLSLCFKP